MVETGQAPTFYRVSTRGSFRATRFSAASLLLAVLAGCSKKQAATPQLAQLTKEANVAQGNKDLELVEDYVANWDRFARGENDLIPSIRDNKDRFEAALSRLLNRRDKRAPSRLVFYAVVQVGGFIPLDSELGRASEAFLGRDFPVFT